MKGLSVKQPFASLIAAGQKTIETRSRKTEHRGRLLICASKEPHKGVVLLPLATPTWSACPLAMRLYPAFQKFGVALCVVNLIDCRPMTPADEAAACCQYYEGAWAWVLDNVRPVEQVPVRGQLGLFEVPDGLHKLIFSFPNPLKSSILND